MPILVDGTYIDYVYIAIKYVARATYPGSIFQPENFSGSSSFDFLVTHTTLKPDVVGMKHHKWANKIQCLARTVEVITISWVDISRMLVEESDVF